MEVVDVNDFNCHSDGEDVILMDLDKPNDSKANNVRADDVQVKSAKELGITIMLNDGKDFIIGESEDESDTSTTAAATITTAAAATITTAAAAAAATTSEVDVVVACDQVLQRKQTDSSNVVKLISPANIINVGASNNTSTAADSNVSQSSEVVVSVDRNSSILAELRDDCIAASDDDIDIIFEGDEIVECQAAVCENEIVNSNVNDANETNVRDEETIEIINVTNNEVVDETDKATKKESVTIEAKNPDGSIVVKKDKMTVTIPQHIAGRDITALNEDTPSRSGKRMLNPRFGVKVPYIHMTSQIVTQDEIAQELFQRFQKKYPLTRVDKPDKIFAMKLTHRLANKIAPLKTPDKKSKNITKNSKKVINIKNKLLNNKSRNSIDSCQSKIQSSNVNLPNITSKESIEVDDSQHIDQITNTLQILDQSADQHNVSDDKNNEKINSNEELIAILEDFETIETADTNGNKIDDTVSKQVPDTNSNKDAETNSNVVANTNINIVSNTNGEKLTETPKQIVRRKIVRSTTRTKRCKPKLDPEVEKQIALKQLQEVSRPKRFDSHFAAKRKIDIEKKLVTKNDLNSPQKRKKSTPEVPEVKIGINHYIKTYTDKRQSTVKVESTSNDETAASNDVIEVESEPKANPLAKARTMREINRLLGDEGAINMIYSLEKRRSPGNNNSKNVLPSTRRMKKDLMLKTKLVKNAMLKMSAPTSSLMPTNRLGRRSDVCTPSPSPENKCSRKMSIDSQGSDHSISFPSRKTIPANESKIIRKHSSSSEASSIGNSPILPVANAAPMNDETIKHTPVKALRVYTRKNKNSDDQLTTLDQSFDEATKGTNKSIGKTKNIVSQKVKKQPTSSKMSRSLAESIKQEIEDTTYNEITVRRYDGVVHITLTPVTTVMKNALNISVMEELMKELNCLKNDDTCKVVLVSSAGRIFCQGLDISQLIHDDSEKCKKAAVDISSTLKKFITCISDFPKLLVAGVDGAAVGLGATMLVHFDLVFASDKATFETPYAQLGHIAEGAATTILGRLLVAEMIMGSQRLTAGQAHYYGLVTRTLWPDRFHDELIPLVKALARQSLQAMKTSKALQKQETKEKLAKALETETHILIKQWTSDECQQNLQAYLKDAVDNINI